MQDLMLWIGLVVSIAVSAHLQVRYARANYPKEWRWRIVLFVMGGIVFGIFGFIGQRLEGLSINIFALAVFVLLGGIGSAWLSPRQMRYLIPQRPNQEQ
jgi:hypothetical protein